MPMSKQARKHSIGLAGEFLVAGELLRRGIMAAVTYGNAKKADVIAFHEGRATKLEVKSTSESRWVLGGSLPDDTASLWVLVHLPVDTRESPRYFVLKSSELLKLIRPVHDAYNRRYQEKHGKPYSGRGVVSIERKLIEDQRDAWQKVERAVGLTSQ